MRVISIIHDGLLNADNIMLEMTIRDYLCIGRSILKDNPYQRKRVSRSSTIYSMLNADLQKLCTIPTITLAFSDGCNDVSMDEDMLHEQILSVLQNNLIILDGLQRTYTLIDVDESLMIEGVDKESFYNHRIRIELFKGLTRTGILYRMLTLNTGQTPMSKRHEIEILYSSFLDCPIENIKFIKQASSVRRSGIDEYDFDDAIEGFNSFIDSDESAMDHFKLLSIIQRLEKITNDDYQKDLFREFILLYNRFVHKFDDLSQHWVAETNNPGISSVYGCDIPAFFNKSQTMSAFGAALGEILWIKEERGLGDIGQIVINFVFEKTPNETMSRFLEVLDAVRMKAKKIGVAQRLFLKYFFVSLFNADSDSFKNVDSSIEQALNLYNDDSRL